MAEYQRQFGVGGMMAYVDVEDLKVYLDISGVTDDLLLAALIERAQSLIEQLSRRTFEASNDTTRTFDALEDTDGVTLWLDDDLCAITTVTNGDGVEVGSDEYTTWPRNETPYYAIRLLSSSGKSWTWETDHEDAITVKGKWAWSTSAPADIAHATIRLAGWLYHQRDSGKEYDRAIIAGNTTILPASFPSDVVDICHAYRRLN